MKWTWDETYDEAVVSLSCSRALASSMQGPPSGRRSFHGAHASARILRQPLE